MTACINTWQFIVDIAIALLLNTMNVVQTSFIRILGFCAIRVVSYEKKNCEPFARRWALDRAKLGHQVGVEELQWWIEGMPAGPLFQTPARSPETAPMDYWVLAFQFSIISCSSKDQYLRGFCLRSTYTFYWWTVHIIAMLKFDVIFKLAWLQEAYQSQNHWAGSLYKWR